MRIAAVRLQAIALAGTLAIASPPSAQAQVPAGGAWRIVSVGPVFLVPAPQGRVPEIVFDADEERFGASLGCNRFAGGYSTAEGGLRFAEAIAATKMLCPPPLDTLETAFAAMLAEVRGFAEAGGAAALLDGDGAALAILVAAE